jgi:hypothetical protein
LRHFSAAKTQTTDTIWAAEACFESLNALRICQCEIHQVLAASPFSISFVSYLKRLLRSETAGGSPSKSPQPFKHYTKAALKANPPGV